MAITMRMPSSMPGVPLVWRFDTVDECLSFLPPLLEKRPDLTQAASAAVGERRRVSRRGLGPRHIELLRIVLGRGRVTMNELAEAMSLTHNQVAGLRAGLARAAKREGYAKTALVCVEEHWQGGKRTITYLPGPALEETLRA